MKLFSRTCSIIAIWFLNREWRELSERLARLRDSARGRHDVPTLLAQELLISGEDHRFFRHGGVDPIAICRAIWRRIARGSSEGASTIEMQVVRVVSGRFELTLRRKIREMALATLVTRIISKEDLPAIYLTIGYYGWRMNGWTQACRRLDILSGSMSVAETAQLVARLKYPQPKNTGKKRWERIHIRAQHLLSLHLRHQNGLTYDGLQNIPAYETI